jgi:hypothetical protein
MAEKSRVHYLSNIWGWTPKNKHEQKYKPHQGLLGFRGRPWTAKRRSTRLKSAERFGNVIVFEFAKKLCLAGGADIKNTTFFFGLAADAVPMAISAQIFSIGTPPLYNVDARVPVH